MARWGSTSAHRVLATPGEQLTAEQRQELILDYLPLVRSLARRYVNRGEGFDDLFQVGVVGLIMAIDRFDPSRGTRLASYATATVLGEIRRYFRDNTRTVRIPQALQNTCVLVNRTSDELQGRLRRRPSVHEIAAELKIADEDVIDALVATETGRPLSLIGSDDERGIDVAVEDPGFEWAEGRAVIRANLHTLSERDRTIIDLRFNEGRTQAQIAARIGVSQMQVSRLLTRALDRLRSGAVRPSDAGAVACAATTGALPEGRAARRVPGDWAARCSGGPPAPRSTTTRAPRTPSAVAGCSDRGDGSV